MVQTSTSIWSRFWSFGNLDIWRELARRPSHSQHHLEPTRRSPIRRGPVSTEELWLRDYAMATTLPSTSYTSDKGVCYSLGVVSSDDRLPGHAGHSSMASQCACTLFAGTDASHDSPDLATDQHPCLAPERQHIT